MSRSTVWRQAVQNAGARRRCRRASASSSCPIVVASPASAKGVSGLSSRRVSRHAAVIGNDLLVKPARGGAKQRQASQQDDARLRAGADDRGDAADRGAKALADEARNQPLDEAMFKMELDHILRLRLALA